MLMIEFITWWYGQGYMELFGRISKLIKNLWQRFSVPTLMSTMFQPWRRITSEYGKSIQEKFRALVDNTVSRFVGFLIRISVIISAFVTILFIAIMGGILIVAWPLAPVIILALIIWALL